MSAGSAVPDIIEPPSGRILSTLNWLRAGVLGANDGVVSTASIIFGVAGANAAHSTILLAGIASVAAGALSMAVTYAVGYHAGGGNFRSIRRDQFQICKLKSSYSSSPR